MSDKTYRVKDVVSCVDEDADGAMLYNPDTDESVLLNPSGRKGQHAEARADAQHDPQVVIATLEVEHPAPPNLLQEYAVQSQQEDDRKATHHHRLSDRLAGPVRARANRSPG